ncbi:2-oxo acid dehydrogenase subunit E2 [Actinomycetes bacterium M1A6_2h]
MRDVPLVMPKMSMTMTEGTFIVWHKKEGDAIKNGDVVCEVASDKVDMEVESPVDGTLGRLVAAPDDVIEVGAPLAFITTDADDMLDGLFDGPDSAPPPAAVEPEPQLVAATGQVGTPPSRRGPQPAVPFARRRASELRIDLRTVMGSGPDGLVTVKDVESAAAVSAPAAEPTVVTQPAPTPQPDSVAQPVPTAQPAPVGASRALDFSVFGPTESVPLSRIARVSGPALTASWTTIPHVTHHDEADITRLDAYRKEIDAEADGYRVTLLAFVLKAVVAALKEYPRVNSSLDTASNSVVLKRYYRIGVAVDTENGLVVPAIADVDRKGITELSQELGAVSQRARDGKLTGDDVSGASFTVSSLGGIGGTGFTPIVNSPEAAILGVSRGKIAPFWNGEDFVPRLQLPLSLSYDHRIIDGALAARFTAHVAYVLGDVRRLVL